MKAKKMLTLLLSGAMALTMGVMAACDNGNNSGGGGGNTPTPPPVGGDYTLDNTEYYLAGDGAGTLSQNGWTVNDHSLKLERDAQADHNVFKITIDMYAGDEFKIVHDDSWTGEMGITFMEGVDEDKNVTDSEGNVIFKESGSFGGNICLNTDNDGTYTFSLHTYPDGEKTAYISYVKDADLEPLPPTVDMYVVSDMNELGWGDDFKETSHMTQNGTTWKAVVEVKAEDVTRNEEGDVVEGGEYAAVAVRNEIDDENGTKIVTCDMERTPTWTDDEDGGEYNLLKVGVYTLIFEVGVDECKLTITDGAFELYFTGSFNDNTASDEYKLTEDAAGNWYGYITLEEAAQVSLYNKYTEGTYSVNDGAQLEAGDYFVKFIAADQSVAHEALAYYIAGTVENAEWGVVETSPKLELNEETGVYTVDLLDVEMAELKVVYGTVLGGVKTWYGVGADGNDNANITTAGDYTVTFNPATKELSISEAVLEVTVSFDLNYPEGVEGPEGQVAPPSQTLTKRQTATQPTEELTLEGYNFLGWYTDKECTDIFDFAAPVTKNVTLYARWVAEEVEVIPNITFNYNYTGAPAANVVATVEGKVTKPEDPTRKGYHFLGWYTSVSGNTLFNFETPVSVDTNVYAHWVYAYHIVGSLSNDDRIGSWATGDYGLTLELVPDSNHPLGTYFKIELTLYLGDQFKIVGPDNWNDGYAAGGGCLRGDSTQLAGSDNIEVKAPGNYVIYLSIDGNWEITWSYEAFASTSNNEMYIVMGETETKMAFDGASKWLASIKVRNGVTVKLVDKGNGNKEYAVNLTSNGDYEVSFNTSDNSVTVTEVGYFIAGAFTNPSWGVGATSPKLTWNEELGAYAVEITTTSANAQCKVVIGSTTAGVTNWNDDDNKKTATTEYVSVVSGNLSIKTAGTYIIAYDTTTGTITVTPKA